MKVLFFCLFACLFVHWLCHWLIINQHTNTNTHTFVFFANFLFLLSYFLCLKIKNYAQPDADLHKHFFLFIFVFTWKKTSENYQVFDSKRQMAPRLSWSFFSKKCFSFDNKMKQGTHKQTNIHWCSKFFLLFWLSMLMMMIMMIDFKTRQNCWDFPIDDDDDCKIMNF